MSNVNKTERGHLLNSLFYILFTIKHGERVKENVSFKFDETDGAIPDV